MVFGTFDVLHLGHMHLFDTAKSKADELVVVVSQDERAQNIKGLQPIFSQEERRQLVQYIKQVDKVVIGDREDVYKPILSERPDVIVLGYDQSNFVDGIEFACKQAGFEPEIIRATSFKPQTHKSGRIKQAIDSTL